MHSGKSTVAKYLVDTYGFKRIRFAHRLKAMLVEGLGLTWADVDDPVLKQTPHPRLNGRTPRECLQTLGTEWGRGMVSESLWVDRAEDDIIEAYRAGRSVVVDDLRFANEEAMLACLGAYTFRIVRPGLAAASSGHASENQDFPVQFTLDNSGCILDLHLQVDQILDRIHEGLVG